MRELFRSPYFIVTVDDARRLVRRARTEQGFTSIPEAEAAYNAVIQAIDSIGRQSHVLLADMRLAPPRNDAAFEQLVTRNYPRLYGGFRRAAALVKTQTGKLQIARLMGESGTVNVPAFVEEMEALAYLESDPRPSSRRGFGIS